MRKISTVQAFGNEIFEAQKLTIGKSWGPIPTETVGREDDYQVAAPTETRTPT
jgi:hypothetical protein